MLDYQRVPLVDSNESSPKKPTKTNDLPGEGPVTVTSDGILAESSVPRWVRNPWEGFDEDVFFWVAQQIVGTVN